MTKTPAPLNIAIDSQVMQAITQETKDALEGLKKADPQDLVVRLKALITDIAPYWRPEVDAVAEDVDEPIETAPKDLLFGVRMEIKTP